MMTTEQIDARIAEIQANLAAAQPAQPQAAPAPQVAEQVDPTTAHMRSIRAAREASIMGLDVVPVNYRPVAAPPHPDMVLAAEAAYKAHCEAFMARKAQGRQY